MATLASGAVAYIRVPRPPAVLRGPPLQVGG